MDLADQELIAEFVIEAQEGLENVESQLLEIEAGGADIDANLINSVFRTMHSIKGSAGFLGLDRIGALAHGLEEVLDDMRNREVIPTSELVTSVLRASDYMTELIDAVETSEEADVAPYIDELKQLRNRAVKAAPEAAAEPQPEAEMALKADPQPEQTAPIETAAMPAGDAEDRRPPTGDDASPPLDDTTRAFLTECLENLDKMDQELVTLEQDPAEEQLLRSIFRTIHTIKGGAGFLGLAGLERLTHAAESILSKIRSDELCWNSDVAAALLATVDSCREGLRLVETSGSDNEFDAPEIVEQLLQIAACSKRVDSPVKAEGSPAAATPAPNKTSSSEQPRPEASRRAASTPKTKPSQSAAPAGQRRTADARPKAARPKAARTEESAARATKAASAKAASAKAASNKAASTKDSAAKAAAGGAQGPKRTRPKPAATTAKPTSAPAVKSKKAGEAAKSASPKAAAASRKAASAASNPASASESTIRVDVSLLDKLMTRVGELVLARNQILQFTNGQDDSGFVSTAQRLNLITTEIQEDVMKTRMQPIGNVWAKFPRVVRDLSKQMGKQIRIEMEGKETELDKTIVEAIKDPLTHLVRNSVDHGIESPEDRVAKGKPPEGCLSLRAYHEGGHVNIEISDDGAGLNLDRIRSKALEKGLISPDRATAMTEREAAQLILMPGFSTAQQVSSVSGRGVGMDVVKTNIEKISGTIDVHSEPENGTTIRIKIPLTLAIIPALVISNGGNRYAIPQVSLLELVRLEGDAINHEIELVHNSPVYRLRGTLLPLVNLSDRLGLKSESEPSREEDPADRVINIVVLRANEQQFGLIVDGVNDTEEIVVKPLSRQLKGVQEYAGTTIMGDGTVALILDVAGLATSAGLVGSTNDSDVRSASADASDDDEKQNLLIVDLGDQRRFALPTSMVARLERVASSQVEHAGGREVIQYRGAIMPLIRLANVFGQLQPCDQQPEELQIVVYADDDERIYGLVVNRIVDIVETSLRFQSTYDDNDNLLGAAVVQDRVTDVLNMRNLVKQASRPNRPELMMN